MIRTGGAGVGQITGMIVLGSSHVPSLDATRSLGWPMVAHEQGWQEALPRQARKAATAKTKKAWR
ncbi:Uncharacterised protein [Bordetella pertussis]|nr:Uncharacterised protein [Bordetella pertussis]